MGSPHLLNLQYDPIIYLKTTPVYQELCMYVSSTTMKTLMKAAGFFTVVCVVGWLVLSRDVLHPSLEDMFVQQRTDPTNEKTMSERVSDYWKSADLTAKTIPESAFAAKDKIEVTNGMTEIMTLNIFFRQALPPQDITPSNLSILFLHGQKFQSKNWEDLGTLQLMAALGHAAVAIDLPGYGNTGGEQFPGNRAMFLASTMELLSMHNVIIVSPSMSGRFSMPFLENYSDSLNGYVPIAPVASHSVPKTKLQLTRVPTLLVFGDGDTTGLAQQSRSSLKALPYYREFELKDAGHAAYLDQPDLFHKVLYNYMELLQTQPRPEGPITWRNWKTWKRQSLLSRIK